MRGMNLEFRSSTSESSVKFWNYLLFFKIHLILDNDFQHRTGNSFLMIHSSFYYYLEDNSIRKFSSLYCDVAKSKLSVPESSLFMKKERALASLSRNLERYDVTTQLYTIVKHGKSLTDLRHWLKPPRRSLYNSLSRLSEYVTGPFAKFKSSIITTLSLWVPSRTFSWSHDPIEHLVHEL